MSKAPLSTNGLVMPSEFPVGAYEAVFATVQSRAKINAELFEQFGGAWNAIAYRYLAACEDGAAFTKSVGKIHPNPLERYAQERQLFGLFSNCFSVFDASFYALFSLGAHLDSERFPLLTEKDRQRISPASTMEALKRAFPNDPINEITKDITTTREYVDLREVRNILTHRAAPGRTFFANLDTISEPVPDIWKLKGISLDAQMAPDRLRNLTLLLGQMIEATRDFAQVHF